MCCFARLRWSISNNGYEETGVETPVKRCAFGESRRCLSVIFQFETNLLTSVRKPPPSSGQLLGRRSRAGLDFVWEDGRNVRLRRESGVGVLHTPRPFMIIGGAKIKDGHLQRETYYNDEQLIAGLRACLARRNEARPSLYHRQSCRAVEPRTGSWVRYQDHSAKGFFCLLFAASQKAGRRKGETFVKIQFESPLRMHANP